jgi:acetate kinase
MQVLVLNAGSSSLKGSVIEVGQEAALARCEARAGDDASRDPQWATLVDEVLKGLRRAGAEPRSVDAVGHRVVHGGTTFRAAVRIDDNVLGAIDALAEFAPLHNPIAAETIRLARARLSGQPHVAVFDTAFHATLPPAEYRYPVPESWYRDWGVRRFGFHGLSVEWATGRTAELLDRPVDELRLVVAHLGNGCSVTAVNGGRSVSTSMGMTPLEGLMMGTRAGSIDPGIPLALLRDGRLEVGEIADALDHASGLVAMAGTADMRKVVEAEARGDGRAALALQMFVGRAAAGIAAAATALPALDALVFTGGIGEHSAAVRALIAGRLATLGVRPLDASATATVDQRLNPPDAPIALLRIESREDLVIAAHTAQLLG